MICIRRFCTREFCTKTPSISDGSNNCEIYYLCQKRGHFCGKTMNYWYQIDFADFPVRLTPHLSGLV
jgi:hypothetical protein